jgi:hypothetical protein
MAIFLTEKLIGTTTITSNIWSDSKICVQAFTRGHSTHPLLNTIIAHCTLRHRIKWCSTETQRADPLTRGSNLPLPRQEGAPGAILSTTSCSVRYINRSTRSLS